METATAQRRYADERIERIANEAKAEGLKVYTFDTSNPNAPIEQVYVTNGVDIGTLSTRHAICISTGTVHKPCKECGTGFGMNTSDEHTVDLDAVKQAMMTHAPRWATPKQHAAVRKYASWSEYASANSWTTFTQL